MGFLSSVKVVSVNDYITLSGGDTEELIFTDLWTKCGLRPANWVTLSRTLNDNRYEKCCPSLPVSHQSLSVLQTLAVWIAFIASFLALRWANIPGGRLFLGKLRPEWLAPADRMCPKSLKSGKLQPNSN